MSFKFTMIVPTNLVARESVEGVTLPGALGEFTVLEKHTHLATILKPGLLTYKTKDSAGKIHSHQFAIGKGIAEVMRDGSLNVLVDSAQST